MIGDREIIDPSSRIHPAFATLDMPFSLLGDILFLPYDAYYDCQSQQFSRAGSLSLDVRPFHDSRITR